MNHLVRSTSAFAPHSFIPRPRGQLTTPINRLFLLAVIWTLWDKAPKAWTASTAEESAAPQSFTFAWGVNGNGQVGDGTTRPRRKPNLLDRKSTRLNSSH